jgi:hypothetical protein
VWQSDSARPKEFVRCECRAKGSLLVQGPNAKERACLVEVAKQDEYIGLWAILQLMTHARLSHIFAA